MMRNKLIITAIIASVLFAGLAAVRHIDQLNDGIQLKQIEIKDNSAELKLLDNKYQDLNKQLDKKGSDKKELEKQLKELQQERDKLQADLQAKLDAKNRTVAQVTAGAVQTVSAAPAQATGQTTSSCEQLRTRLAGLGVPANQLDAAITLAMRESGCRSSAVNSSSGACGEFQSYPCGKWGAPGTDGYLRAAIGYANSRYGGYNGALAFSYANNWY